MAANEIEICNEALSRLGASPITSLSDNDKRSSTCALLYSRTRDSLLRSHPWNFAIKRASLVADVTTPAFGYSKQFVLPTDYLRIISLEDEDVEYQIEGGKLLTDDSSANILYIARITDTTKFDPMFDMLLALMLAHNMSYSLVQSVTLKANLAQEVQIAMRDVRSADAQEGTPKNFNFNTWLEARY